MLVDQARREGDRPMRRPRITRARRRITALFGPRTQATLRSVYTLRWPILIALLVACGREIGYLPRNSPVVVWLSNLARIFLGGIAAHLFSLHVFGDFNLVQLIRQRHPSAGGVFLGVALIYAAFILATAIAYGG